MLQIILFAITIAACAPLAQAADLNEALLAAARKGDLEEVKRLVAEGANLEAQSRYATTPLYFAARNGHVPVVEFLLAKGANPNVTDTFYKMHLLAAATEKGGVPVIKALLAAGATPPPNLLPMAAAQAPPEALRFLIDALKPPPDALTAALQTATMRKNEANAAVLRESGAKAPELKTVTLPPETLARYTGSYTNDAGGIFNFTVKDGKLTGGPPDQPLVLDALDERTFAPTAVPTARIVFNEGAGPATGFTLTNMGQNVVFKRTGSKP